MAGEKNEEPKGRGVGLQRGWWATLRTWLLTDPGAVGATKSFHAGERCDIICLLKSTWPAVEAGR